MCEICVKYGRSDAFKYVMQDADLRTGALDSNRQIVRIKNRLYGQAQTVRLSCAGQFLWKEVYPYGAACVIK